MFLKAVWGTLQDMGPFYIENVYGLGKRILWDAPQRFYLDIELEYLRLKRIAEPDPEPEPEPEPERKKMINTLLSRYWRIYM